MHKLAQISGLSYACVGDFVDQATRIVCCDWLKILTTAGEEIHLEDEFLGNEW